MASPIDFTVDEIRTRIVEQPHEGRIYVERTQPGEDAILAVNAELRKEQLLRDLEFGRLVAKIPLLAFFTVIPRYYPRYLDGTGPERKAVLMRMLLDHPEWCVQPKEHIHAR